MNYKKYIKWIKQNYIIVILSILIASAPFIGALIGKYSVKTSINNNVEINK